MLEHSERRPRRFSSSVMLLVVASILFILAIAVPKGGRMSNANEMAVVRELQTINTKQVEYKSKFQRFATTLAELGPHGADLIPSTLASGDKDGYVFIMT